MKGNINMVCRTAWFSRNLYRYTGSTILYKLWSCFFDCTWNKDFLLSFNFNTYIHIPTVVYILHYYNTSILHVLGSILHGIVLYRSKLYSTYYNSNSSLYCQFCVGLILLVELMKLVVIRYHNPCLRYHKNPI